MRHVLRTEASAQCDDPVVVRLYEPRPTYAEGGLASAAEAVRRGGEMGDDVLLHINKDEYRQLCEAWGEPTINDNTGLPEWGLKRLFKKAGKFVKRALKNPIVGAIAPIAMNMLLPGVGGLIGQTLFGAASSKAKGGNPLLGALTGAAGHIIGGGGAKGTGANASATLQDGLGKIGNWGAGQSGTLGKLATTVANKGSTLAAIGRSPLGRVATGIGGSALRSMDANYQQALEEQAQAGQPGQGGMDNNFGESLVTPSFRRNRRTMAQPDFFTYGQGPQAEEFQFFDPNAIDAPEEPVVALADGGGVSGPGTGRSDEIEALLSDGEYVMDAETVALLGDGSVDAGAERLDAMRERLRKHKGRALAKGKFSPNAKEPEHYLGAERRAKGGGIKRVLEGGVRKTREEREAQLAHARRVAEALMKQVPDSKHTAEDWAETFAKWGAPGGRGPRERRASGGSVRRGPSFKDMVELANKFEHALTSNDRGIALATGKALDSRVPGLSGKVAMQFAKGGSVAKALREFKSLFEPPPSRLLQDVGAPRADTSPQDLEEIVMALEALQPQSNALHQYKFGQQKRREPPRKRAVGGKIRYNAGTRS